MVNGDLGDRRWSELEDGWNGREDCMVMGRSDATVACTSAATRKNDGVVEKDCCDDEEACGYEGEDQEE